MQRVPAATIARLYFSANENGGPPADLVELAIQHGSSVLAEHLKASTRKYGSARLSAVTLAMVEEAARLAVAQPAADHAVGAWFRRMVALHLKASGVATLGDLIDFCNRRGGSWWRAIRRIAPGVARGIVGWLRLHETSIGRSVGGDVDVRYLAGNPWQVVNGPVIIQHESDLQLERVRPASLSNRLRTFIDVQCLPLAATYWRIVRVATPER